MSVVVSHFAPNTLFFRDFTKLLQLDHTADYYGNCTAVLYQAKWPEYQISLFQLNGNILNQIPVFDVLYINIQSTLASRLDFTRLNRLAAQALRACGLGSPHRAKGSPHRPLGPVGSPLTSRPFGPGGQRREKSSHGALASALISIYISIYLYFNQKPDKSIGAAGVF